MKLAIPYSFVSIADPYWFLADLYAVRDFYNGLIDDYNVKESNITTAKIKDGEIKGHHFEDLAATNAKFKSVGHNPATADKIQQASIGPFDMRGDTGGDGANNVKGLFTPSDNQRTIKVWTGVTDTITLDATARSQITDALLWSDLISGFSGFLNKNGVTNLWGEVSPDVLVFATIEILTGSANFIRPVWMIPFTVTDTSVRFLLSVTNYETSSWNLPNATIKILIEVWDIGD